MNTKETKKRSVHAKFWSLLRLTPGYEEKYKDLIKEGIVNEYSGGKTTSLAEMYERYRKEYDAMIASMAGDPSVKRKQIDKERDLWAKRVIASICSWIDLNRYQVENKVDYAKRIACRSARCERFNKIPLSKLRAIYAMYRKMNGVLRNPEPALSNYVSMN